MNGSSSPCALASDGYSAVHISVLGQSGEEYSEIGPNKTWSHTNVFANGEVLATYTPTGLYYAMNDWQGTKRGQTNSSVTSISIDQNTPYGDGFWIGSMTGSAQDSTPHHLTGQIHDAESGNDYFGARFYNSTAARFLSPDWSTKPEDVPYASLSDPQSLNLYAYLRNNPLSSVDADGHGGCDLCDQLLDIYSKTFFRAGKTDKKKHLLDSAQQQNQPATPNPNGSVPAPAPGKAPGWKPGDPLTPNEWVPGKGSNSPDGRPTRWDPKYPIPGGSQPNTSWDAPNGHWDNPDGKGNTTRWLPGGVPVDHDNNPITRNVVRGAAAGAAAIGTGYIIYRVIRMLPSLAPPLWPTIPANAIIP